MTTKTVTIGKDGSLIVTKTDDDGPTAPQGSETGMATIVRSDHHRGIDGGSFVAGLFVGMIILLLAQRWRRSRMHRSVKLDRRADDNPIAAEVAALARRTATLETIVTDPAQRPAREIDALR